MENQTRSLIAALPDHHGSGFAAASPSARCMTADSSSRLVRALFSCRSACLQHVGRIRLPATENSGRGEVQGRRLLAWPGSPQLPLLSGGWCSSDSSGILGAGLIQGCWSRSRWLAGADGVHLVSMCSDARVGSLKLAMEGMFTAWKSVNAINQCCFCFVIGEMVYHQHTMGFTLSLVP